MRNTRIARKHTADRMMRKSKSTKQHTRLAKKLTAGVLAFCMTCSLAACGKKQPEEPELLEPVSGTESYREVAYGDVGTKEICYGTIVPMEHAHFWTTNVTIEDIKVDIGDYVQVGDVLATADLDVAQEQLDALSASLSLLQSTFELQEKIHTLKLQELTLKSEGLAAIGDTDGVNETATEIATEEENARYDKLLYTHQVADIEEQMQKQREIIEEGTLVAHASGYVTYVRSMWYDGMVDSTDNIVVIADYEEPYIQVKDYTIDDGLLEKYTSYYTIQNGEKLPLKEFAYAADERMIAESQMKYPALRMQYEDENAIGEIGTVIPIFLVKDRTEHVLLVGNDSIYEDETGTFVYVKNGDTREQRYIEIGNKDYVNTEVLSGLSEGEKVYYTSEAVWPEQYEAYTAEVSDCEALVYTDRYSVTNSAKKIYKSEYEGTVVSVHTADHATVQKGDLIAVIETNEGSAKLAEMRNAIESTKQGYTDAKAAYDTTIADLSAQKQAAGKPAVTTPVATETDATPTDASETEVQNPNIVAMLDIEMQIADVDFQIQTLQYEKQLSDQEKEYTKVSCNNDGSGNCAIYAERDGRVENITLSEGKKVKVGDTLYYLSVETKEKLSLLSSDDVALGSTVTLTGQTTGEVITGKVCGTAGSNENGPCYLTTVNQKVYVTQSIALDGVRTYVDIPDTSVLAGDEKYTISYTTTSIQDAVVLPADLIYTEEKRGGTEGTLSYVWKIVDDNLEKQYVNVRFFTTKYDTGSSQTGDTQACILDGVSEGDVLAREIKADEE